MTPPDGRVTQDKPTMASEYSLLLTMMYLGEPIAYQDEKEGMLIQNLCPVRGQEHKQENTGSVFLEFHTENGFHPFKPDFIGLCCLRADHERVAKTATASVWRALETLSADTIALLRKPAYRTRLPSSFLKRQTKAAYASPVPILSGGAEKPELCIDFYATDGLSTEAQHAFEALKRALEHVIIEVVLLPGDLLLIDNRVAVHARTDFQPRYDGQDRWLQRLFVLQDLRRSLVGRPLCSHVCRPMKFLPDGDDTMLMTF
jgi:L-asparagine oxygenase